MPNAPAPGPFPRHRRRWMLIGLLALALAAVAVWLGIRGLPEASGLGEHPESAPNEEPAFSLPVEEELTYAIMWKGLHAGTITLTVAERTKLRGRPAYRVVMRVDSGQVLDAVFAIHDRLESHIDAQTGASLRFARSLREGTWDPYKADDRVDFDYGAGVSRYRATDDDDGDGSRMVEHKPRPIPGPLQDPLSLLYHVRHPVLEPGGSRTITVGTRKKSGTLRLQAGEEQTLAIPGLGTFTACRIAFSSPDKDKTSAKVRLFLKKGDLALWVDRETGVPLKLELTAVPILGSLEAVLRGARNSVLKTAARAAP